MLLFWSISTHPISIIIRGARLGAFAGVMLSAVYTAVAIPMVGVAIVLTNIPSGKVFEALLGAGAFAICAWPFAILVGILPGTLLGLLGGLVIGLLVAPLHNYISRRGAALIGFVFGGALVLSGHLFLSQGLIDPQQAGLMRFLPYVFWIGGPSLPLLTGSTWVGWKVLEESSNRLKDD